MKVYLVQVDNGDHYENYYRWTEKVFTTYMGAAQYLIDEGYEPYSDFNYETNEPDVSFCVELENNFESEAEIAEMEVEEYK
ncbi:MAG: hypothetical protein ACI35O_03915 [Bacillaceae bacterium]